MRRRASVFCLAAFLLVCIGLSFLPLPGNAQSYATWYRNAQERIDTLRKGNFGFQIFDQLGQPYTGQVSVRMKKHEFPFGIAFDFYEGSASMGNSYSTTAVIQAEADAEIYRTERWNNYLAYLFPVETGKEYRLTLQFAEIYFNSGNSRLFDVFVEGNLFLDNFDVFTEAGGKNIARDTSLVFYTIDNELNIELSAVRDNAMIKGIVIEETGGATLYRINCGGQALTTADGNRYETEAGYFDPDANTVASKEQWMQAAMYKYFNYGVSGNSFKWSGIQPQHTAPNYTNFDNAVRWTQKVGWELRAHTLLWGGNDAHSMPDWIRALPTPQAITDTCKMRVQREVTRYKGIVKEYDVINEPLTGHADWLRKTVGDSIIWNCFKWAREADPDAELFINDYNVEYNWGQAREYRDLIVKIKEMGGPVTGVGIQAHFWDGMRPNVDEVVKNLNIIAEAGLPMRLTEYDWGKDLTQKQQVDDFIKVATIAFSHPSITGMICWALSDDGAWRDNSGFFDANHKPKLAADTLLYYTQTKWATHFDSVINAENPVFFNAYYGDYTLEVVFDGITKVFTLPCRKANEDSVFILNETDAKQKGPQLLKAELCSKNTVRLLFDKPLESASIRRNNFKFFSKREIGLTSVQADPEDEGALLLSLGRNVPEGDYISVAYFPGKLQANDGSRVEAFGPEGIPNPVIVSDALLQQECLGAVFPNPAHAYLQIEHPNFPFRVSLYHMLGVPVLTQLSESDALSLDVGKLARGMYLLQISDETNETTHRKVLLQ